MKHIISIFIIACLGCSVSDKQTKISDDLHHYLQEMQCGHCQVSYWKHKNPELDVVGALEVCFVEFRKKRLKTELITNYVKQCMESKGWEQ